MCTAVMLISFTAFWNDLDVIPLFRDETDVTVNKVGGDDTEDLLNYISSQH